MAYNDDRSYKKVGKGPPGRDTPLNAKPKSTQNPPKHGGNFDNQVSLNRGGNPLQMGEAKDGAPMYRKGGMRAEGKSPGTPAVAGRTQVPAYTSHPFKGRANVGGSGSNLSGKGSSKAWGNDKRNNAP